MCKVLYITHDGLLDPLGSSQILPYLYGLNDNFKISVLSFEKKDKLKSKEYFDLKKELNDKGINYYHLRFLPKLYLPLQILTGFIKAIKIVKKNKVEFTHARGFVSCIISLLLKKTIGIPYIFDMRGFWVEERVDAGVIDKGSLFNILKKIENSLMTNASQIVVLTNMMKQELIDKYNIKTPINVIFTCVDTNQFRHKKHNYEKLKPVYLGSCGTFYNFKKVLDFFKILNEKMGAELTLILNNPEFLSEEEKEEIETNKNITLLKKVKREKIPELLKKSNFSIFFYTVPNSRKGFFPTRLGESLACGLPVVTNKGIGDCDEFIEKNGVGVLVNDFSEKEMLKAIDKMKTLIKKQDLSFKCRKTAEKYLDLSKGVGKYEGVYRNFFN